MAGTLQDVTDTNFQAEVIESDQLRIVKLNVDENQQTAARYGVMSIPTLIVFKNGEAAKTIVGALPKKRLQAELEPALA